MSVFVEAMILLLPAEAGGRTGPVAPREGSYRPFVRIEGQIGRARLLEGPALLSPGEGARVMIELETDTPPVEGCEFQLLEHDARIVGVASVLRVYGRPTFV
jgi:translation elongation factor EF-Tu-like GTPase